MEQDSDFELQPPESIGTYLWWWREFAWTRKITFSFLAFLSIYLLFLNHTEPTELGIARNLLTGNMWTQHAGWHCTLPWTLVSVIDTRPVRVSVQSSGRGFSARLVHFVPDQWREFVNTEGFKYYWWSNRISFNLGYAEEHRGMKDIMRGYAYGKKEYPFIQTLTEY